MAREPGSQPKTTRRPVRRSRTPSRPVPEPTPAVDIVASADAAPEPAAEESPLEPREQGTPHEAQGAQPAPSPSRKQPNWWERLASPTVAGVVVAILAGILAAGATSAAVLSRPAIYDSQVAMTIDQPKAIVSAGSDGIVAKLNALRLKYLTLMTTGAFTGPVAAKLGIPAGEVASSVEANVLGPSLVMLVGARNRVPGTAQKIAQAMAEQTVSYVSQEEARAFIPPADQIIVEIVVPAYPAQKVEPTKRRALAYGAVSGAIALAVFYCLVQLVVVRRKT